MKFFANLPYAYRLGLILNLLAISTMALLGFFAIERQQELLEKQFEVNGHTVAGQLANSAVEPLFTSDVLALAALTNSLSNDVIGASIYAEDGQELAFSGVKLPKHIYKYYLANASLKVTGSKDNTPNNRLTWDDPSGFFETGELVTFVFPIKFKEIVGGHSLITLSRKDILAAKQEALLFIFLIGVALLLLLLAATWIISQRMSKPVYDLIYATQALSHDKFDYRIENEYMGEFGQLVTSFNNMALELEKKHRVETAFNQFVSNSVASEYLDNTGPIERGGTLVTASIVFVDIVGYTELSKRHKPEEVAEILNEYFNYFSYSCNFYGGHVDKFIGDCAMMVFGAPKEDITHRFHAVACSLLINKIVEEVNQVRWKEGKPCINIRTGIACGSVLAGLLGSADRLQYTVVGDAVNLAARLCDIAPVNSIVTDQVFVDTNEQLGNVIFESYRTTQVKGLKNEVNTVQIMGFENEPEDHFAQAKENLEIHVK